MKKSIRDQLLALGFIIGLIVFIVLIFLFPPLVPILLCTAMPLIGYLKLVLKMREGKESAQRALGQLLGIGGVMMIGFLIPLAFGSEGLPLAVGVGWVIAVFFLAGLAMFINDIMNEKDG